MVRRSVRRPGRESGRFEGEASRRWPRPAGSELLPRSSEEREDPPATSGQVVVGHEGGPGSGPGEGTESPGKLADQRRDHLGLDRRRRPPRRFLDGADEAGPTVHRYAVASDPAILLEPLLHGTQHVGDVQDPLRGPDDPLDVVHRPSPCAGRPDGEPRPAASKVLSPALRRASHAMQRRRPGLDDAGTVAGALGSAPAEGGWTPS